MWGKAGSRKMLRMGLLETATIRRKLGDIRGEQWEPGH